MLELFTEILSWVQDIIFWRDKKKRRKFEKENNLPKKIMINPSDILMGIIVVITIIGLIIYQIFFSSKINNNRTLRKIVKIELLLENEKDKFNIYPNKLNEIIRNNPTLQDVIYDYWDNEFFYKQINNGQGYILISKGKDREINTKDDVRSK